MIIIIVVKYNILLKLKLGDSSNSVNNQWKIHQYHEDDLNKMVKDTDQYLNAFSNIRDNNLDQQKSDFEKKLKERRLKRLEKTRRKNPTAHHRKKSSLYKVKNNIKIIRV